MNLRRERGRQNRKLIAGVRGPSNREWLMILEDEYDQMKTSNGVRGTRTTKVNKYSMIIGTGIRGPPDREGLNKIINWYQSDMQFSRFLEHSINEWRQRAVPVVDADGHGVLNTWMI